MIVYDYFSYSPQIVLAVYYAYTILFSQVLLQNVYQARCLSN